MSLRRVHTEELPEPHSQHRSPPLSDDGLIVLVLNEDSIPVSADSTTPVHLLFQEEQQANTNNPPLPGLPLHLLFYEEEEEEKAPIQYRRIMATHRVTIEEIPELHARHCSPHQPVAKGLAIAVVDIVCLLCQP
ncbi:hypothetical protein DFH07DRAFT_955511 [Mycena maculata]|uniref:Uncharacterized protein n=1 Tax=Mycena maculata TaxID=230809 RepID=A0AAD7NKR2_9AGAR|nr:hypothetical protein DFH07DRAFT_955511 [Mycena maculata]